MTQSLLKFSKMHGLGNDFVVIDAISQVFDPTPQMVRAIGDRHFGVGFDQMLIVRKAESNDHDFRYVIYNCDGSEVENCGNGVRCFARFVVEQGLIDGPVIRVETAAGSMRLELIDGQQVRVDMGAPTFAPSSLPFLADNAAITHQIEVDSGSIELSAIATGNPHAVLLVDNVAEADVTQVGSQIQQHRSFPKSVNVGFLEVVDLHRGKLRVYERGVGETQACGTGACAAAVAGIRRGVLKSPVTLSLLGGDLTLEWAEGESIIMTGPASHVFDGTLDLNYFSVANS
jgi:diaminopimelate epimerase